MLNLHLNILRIEKRRAIKITQLKKTKNQSIKSTRQ